jgi:hypothetical protein
MRLNGIRNLAMAGALGVAGLGLVGLGAHASFTQDAYTQQHITAGTMNVALSSDGGTWSSPTLTMASIGPVGSSFTTGDQPVTITNNGNVTVTGMTFNSLTDPGGNSTFDAETQLCLYKGGSVYNGAIDSFPGGTNVALSIAPGATDVFYVNFYAGGGITAPACGNDGSPSLTNPAQGAAIEPTFYITFSD